MFLPRVFPGILIQGLQLTKVCDPMLFSSLLLTSLLAQGQLQAANQRFPQKDSALLPPSCVLYVEVPGIPRETWLSLLGWVSDQLGPRSPWVPFFPAKTRKGLPLLRSMLRGLPRNGIYQRMTDLASRPFSVGLLREPSGRVGVFEIFHQSSPRMAAYTSRKMKNPLLPSISMGSRILLGGEKWVLDAFQKDWERQLRERSPSVRALEVDAALSKVGGVRGYVDLAAFRPVRGSGKKRMNPGGYLFFGSWEELALGASSLSFGFERVGAGVRGRIRLSGVVGRMDEGTKALLKVRQAPRLGGEPPKGCALSMAFDRKIPAFLSSFTQLFPRPFHQDLQGFLQQLELFFGGQKAEDLLASLQGPFRISELAPGETAPVLRRGGGAVRFGGAFVEAKWVGEKTRKMLVPALQVFALAANQQRKNNGKLPFLLHKTGDAKRGMLEGSLKIPLRPREQTLEDLIHPRLAWVGERLALGGGGARIWDTLEHPPQAGKFHEFYTFDGENLWKIIEGLGPIPQAGFSLNSPFPPSLVAKFWPMAKTLFFGLGRTSLGLRWGQRDALLVLDWRPIRGDRKDRESRGKGGAR